MLLFSYLEITSIKSSVRSLSCRAIMLKFGWKGYLSWCKGLNFFTHQRWIHHAHLFSIILLLLKILKSIFRKNIDYRILFCRCVVRGYLRCRQLGGDWRIRTRQVCRCGKQPAAHRSRLMQFVNLPHLLTLNDSFLICSWHTLKNLNLSYWPSGADHFCTNISRLILHIAMRTKGRFQTRKGGWVSLE